MKNNAFHTQTPLAKTLFLLAVLLFFVTSIFAQAIMRLPDSINTPKNEYWPTLTADNSTLIFTRLITDPRALQGVHEDFYMSSLSKDGWSKAVPIRNINSLENEGAQTISADGRFMIFTGCGQDDSFGSCDLYYSFKIGDTWLPPRNLGADINTDAWETQPALSADGSVLYFVSNRTGGKGKMDIWRSRLLGFSPEGRMNWSPPENLNINTPADDMSPFIHHDNETLYFSSTGYGGEGGFDIFLSKEDSTLGFSPPHNLGKPVNTKNNELGFIVNARGTRAYFVSDREHDNQDIYAFNLPKEHQPKRVYYIKGQVLNKETKAPVLARLNLLNLQTNESEYAVFSDLETGEYMLCLGDEKEFALNVSSEEFLFYSEHISLLENDSLVQNIKNIELDPIALGKTFVLNNLFFDFDKSTLKPASLNELEKLVEFLNQNSLLVVEIGGHTDNRGSDSYNQKLSLDRAHSVQNYLIKKGIDSQRLKSQGYGATEPLLPNTTEENRAQNRRTEVKIIQIVK